MSCSNWESGRLNFSSVEYPKFKRAFREGFNQAQNAEMAEAICHWEKYKTGKLPTFQQDSRDSNRSYYEFTAEQDRFRFLWEQRVATKENPGRHDFRWEDRKRPRKPIRKDFPLATNKQTEFPFDRGNATIVFNASRVVEYDVAEGNRTVEDARENRVGKLFFRLLDRITWTRGTGGEIVGNDEYNQDDRGAGGGGNYPTATYGPKQRRQTAAF